MLAAPIPNNEPARLATLRALRLLDTPSEERFDRLTRVARRLFKAPIALVSLIDENRQWFKSCIGLNVAETSRDISFCGHAILHDDVLVIPDARNDARFYDNPLVTGAPGIRFYAGQPLTAPNGSKLGTLCVIDTHPREFGSEERGLLRDLAQIVEREIAAIELATIDDLTLLVNRRGFEALAQQTLHVCKRLGRHASLLFFDLDSFKQINDTYGHAEGDRALVTFADALRAALRDSDVIGRLGGDEFVALLTDANDEETHRVLKRLRDTLAEANAGSTRGYEIRFSVGQAQFDPERHQSVIDLLVESDVSMYAHKAKQRGGSSTRQM
ncbi:sensor domain-containing diguanylate cyclase [Paraburkholderia fungorum]|jgi:diguanylate cyclase (GGDEF)-like protein|uniref:Sensor domain-containing diguanylate cyclase n=1 Tax=Paraburkholderia fungorum TaxID=134537 RepID=A0AAP5QAP5_9BURK|nr:sensor domain-containing diguanylate cyclase [Paraburkholderia fungorum]MDT8838742.1 sensor domain-containing diguanylate cyclase [Paraburkholderia fungorum]PRZ48560.1 diguanylate cyclase with GAF sensor [Paraburkholderia fungorum]USU21436.1 sensor domain-containing diguanylate cyclase [Paraburkholderia fungorum]USU26569.1 sensor domain-containing diguanylate cyclase [Paraburkholderia fungorum]